MTRHLPRLLFALAVLALAIALLPLAVVVWPVCLLAARWRKKNRLRRLWNETEAAPEFGEIYPWHRSLN